MAPDKNPAVIQDSDPIKHATYKDAMQRYQKDIERKKSMNE